MRVLNNLAWFCVEFGVEFYNWDGFWAKPRKTLR